MPQICKVQKKFWKGHLAPGPVPAVSGPAGSRVRMCWAASLPAGYWRGGLGFSLGFDDLAGSETNKISGPLISLHRDKQQAALGRRIQPQSRELNLGSLEAQASSSPIGPCSCLSTSSPCLQP